MAPKESAGPHVSLSMTSGYDALERNPSRLSQILYVSRQAGRLRHSKSLAVVKVCRQTTPLWEKADAASGDLVLGPLRSGDNGIADVQRPIWAF